MERMWGSTISDLQYQSQNEKKLTIKRLKNANFFFSFLMLTLLHRQKYESTLFVTELNK